MWPYVLLYSTQPFYFLNMVLRQVGSISDEQIPSSYHNCADSKYLILMLYHSYTSVIHTIYYYTIGNAAMILVLLLLIILLH